MFYKLLKPFIVILFIFLLNISLAQQQIPCSSPEGSQFDFWVGEWNLSWQNAKGDTLHGFNNVRKMRDNQT